MASLNQVTIIGNLGRDPEIRTFPNGDQVANISVATTDKWKDKQTGDLREATEWHRVQVFGRLAEIAGQYLRQGSQVCIQGSLRTRKYTDQGGVEKYVTEIRADNLVMLGSPNNGGGNQRQGRGNDGHDDGYGDQGQGGYDNQGYDDRGNNGGRQQPQQRQQGNQRQGNQGNGGQRQQGNGGGQQRQAQQQQRGPQQNQRQQQEQQPPRRAASGFDDMDDDIPF